VAGGAASAYLITTYCLLDNLVTLLNCISYTSMMLKAPGLTEAAIASLTPFWNLLAEHVSWILTQASFILVREDLHGVGSNPGLPATILVVPMYKAQVLEYLNMARHMRLNMARLKVKTLDSAQGDEADIVIGGFVGISGPGFTAAAFHTAPITMRACALDFTILNRGMFIGFESCGIPLRAKHLRRSSSYQGARAVQVVRPDPGRQPQPPHMLEEPLPSRRRATLRLLPLQERRPQVHRVPEESQRLQELLGPGAQH